MHKTINQIVNFMLAGNHPKLDKLRHQYISYIEIDAIEITGFGFYVHFVNSSSDYNSNRNLVIDDVMYTTRANKYQIGLILTISNGLINILEGYSIEPLNQIDEIDEIYYTKNVGGHITRTSERFITELTTKMNW